ncbi:transmembrane and coiled-coil domain-containing protein 5B isoform X3 [Heterocephalus glaber]|uniref:Transmembrane and coiled-coil domain-containing protein 5B isoform X3 n=1 Tax=Heterocephalus glaber TaxID=10181 RepID=A0AAX6RJX2_HETGA|nr:transmembrane and coiled-coil domain-containing protein 5B isoform X3 [Heterocephalus glaber]
MSSPRLNTLLKVTQLQSSRIEENSEMHGLDLEAEIFDVAKWRLWMRDKSDHNYWLIMEIENLEATKQNLNRLNSDLEKDLQTLDEANEALLRKIQEKEKTVQSLERDLTLPAETDKEEEELNQIILEKNDALKNLEVEIAKLEEKNTILSKNVEELQEKISRGLKNFGPTKETLRKNLAELKVKLQQSVELCELQEKEIAKVQSDYQLIHELCEEQSHCIRMYLELLRQLEKEKELLILNKEIAKAQNSSQAAKPGSILVETIQKNMEKTIMKKEKRFSFFRLFLWLFFMALIFIELLGCLFFHLQYINPDLIVDTLPMLMSRRNQKRLRDFLSPLLTLESDTLLPH